MPKTPIMVQLEELGYWATGNVFAFNRSTGYALFQVAFNVEFKLGEPEIPITYEVSVGWQNPRLFAQTKNRPIEEANISRDEDYLESLILAMIDKQQE